MYSKVGSYSKPILVINDDHRYHTTPLYYIYIYIRLQRAVIKFKWALDYHRVNTRFHLQITLIFRYKILSLLYCTPIKIFIWIVIVDRIIYCAYYIMTDDEKFNLDRLIRYGPVIIRDIALAWSLLTIHLNIFYFLNYLPFEKNKKK